ncbi:hypothetical protein AND_008099 [Anopheles darlingi]|uniref:Uncharacterized protein n=1 Tax=Anopheles darlingi TaxID=43151 RepID=W5J8K5_ANODA|nr:hypothetical protein AND_008099 [Anopheles darlingi]
MTTDGAVTPNHFHFESHFPLLENQNGVAIANFASEVVSLESLESKAIYGARHSERLTLKRRTYSDGIVLALDRRSYARASSQTFFAAAFIVIGELVNVTQQQLHRIPAMPSAATVDDAGPSDSTSDLMFVTLVFLLYVVQIVRFLTLPLRLERLEQRDEVQRLKRICMIIVKAVLSGTAS